MKASILTTGLLTLSTFSTITLAAPSSFNEVLTVITHDNPQLKSEVEVKELSIYQAGQLPKYEMNMKSVFEFGESNLKAASHRTLTDKSDVLERLPRLLHPNGVCTWGQWKGLSKTYTGAFAKNRTMPFVGRYSVAMENTEKTEKRGFGFAGKLFPSEDLNAALETENFFTVDVLMGQYQDHIFNTITSNEPDTGFTWGLIKFGMKLANVLSSEDKNPGFRPVKNLSRMLSATEKENKVQALNPKWIRVRLKTFDGFKQNNEIDFRNEVVKAMQDNSQINLIVEGSSSTKDRYSSKGWERVAEINLVGAKVSYGCDRQLHFSHPRLEE
jgi:hypothetical protein